MALLLLLAAGCLALIPEVSWSGGPGVNVTGTVFFRGSVPPAYTVQVSVDQSICGRAVSISNVRVNVQNAGLAGSVVSVEGMSDNHDGPVPAVPATVEISNTACTFSPRVSAAQVGQVVEIRNEDPILHNTHITLGKRTFVNVAQLAGSRPIAKPVKKSGWHMIRCDKHKFMSATLFVFDRPYFAVTDDAGRYQLPPLPPGRYTLRVWHETLGMVTREIDVTTQPRMTIDFSFR